MTASILPPAVTQFISGAGVPLAGGKVYFYVPNTSTPKNTWQDAGETILNTNPVILNASGEAIIYGSGQYRQVVYDASGNLIWDALTADLIGLIQSSSALFLGTSTGSANAQITSPSPAVTSIAIGQEFSFFAGFTNTGPMTITISALTYNVQVGGSATVAGNVVAGMATLIEFDGTNMQLINPQPQYSLPTPGTSGNLLQSNGTIWTSATPLLPAPGTSGNILTSNGAAWLSETPVPPGQTNQQIFTTSGTWSNPTIYSTSAMALIEGWGAGGGGGSVFGAGGGGSYKYGWFLLSSLTSTVAVTIDGGGMGGENGNGGGTTSFGSYLSAYGGQGGYGSGGSPTNAGGSGGGGNAQATANTINDMTEGWGGNTEIDTGAPYVLSGGITLKVGSNGLGGFYTGGGGGYDTGIGGNSVWGGGGGGGSGGTAGGFSVFGGHGGAGSSIAVGSNGSAPGGGGGAGGNTFNGGNGARGQVRVTVFG